MSFLQTIKDAIQSRIGQVVIGEVPEVITAAAEIAANPPQAMHVIAELVAHEIDTIKSTLAEHGDAIAQVSANQPGQPSDTPASATVTAEQVEQIIAAVLESINPKLAALAPVLDLIAQHFPHLKTAE
jgi:hypothetical protein